MIVDATVSSQQAAGLAEGRLLTSKSKQQRMQCHHSQLRERVLQLSHSQKKEGLFFI